MSLESIELGSGRRLVRGRHGWFLVNLNDQYIGQALARYGEYSEIELAFIRQVLGRRGVIVEVGANAGSHTVPLAQAVRPDGRRVLAFEPQPAVFQNLCANLALNAIDNVRAWPYACGVEEGGLYFEPPDYESQGNFGGVAMRLAPLPTSVRVPCVALDDVLIDEQVSFLKIDVEGFELGVLRGAAETIARCRPFIYLENDRVDASPRLIAWLREAGYRMWWHLPPLFNPANFAGDPLNAWPGVVSINLLCSPSESTADVQGLPEVVDANQHPLLGR